MRSGPLKTPALVVLCALVDTSRREGPASYSLYGAYSSAALSDGSGGDTIAMDATWAPPNSVSYRGAVVWGTMP